MSGAIATAAIIGGIGAAGSIGGAAIASSGAKSAAKTQANSADQAAQLNYQASQNALDFQKQQYYNTQQQIQPWLQSGTAAVSNLDYLMGLSPMTSAQFSNQSMNPSFAPSVGLSAGSGAPSPTGSPMLPQRPSSNLATGIRSINDPSLSPTSLSPSTGGLPTSVPRATPALPTSGGQIGGSVAPSGGGLPTSVPRATPALPVGSGGGLSGIATTQNPSQTGNTGGGFGSLMAGYGQQFTAPDLNNTTDPGYQARLQLGTDALQRSAAARGGVLTGGTARDLNQFAQDYASNEYNNVYNRALEGYNTNYNVWANDQANRFNRLEALAGGGQVAANNLSTAGQNFANAASNNVLGTAAAMGQDYQNAGAANASGIAGSANAWGSALGGIGGNISNLYMLSQLQGLGGSGAVNYSGGYANPTELSYLG